MNTKQLIDLQITRSGMHAGGYLGMKLSYGSNITANQGCKPVIE